IAIYSPDVPRALDRGGIRAYVTAAHIAIVAGRGCSPKDPADVACLMQWGVRARGRGPFSAKHCKRRPGGPWDHQVGHTVRMFSTARIAMLVMSGKMGGAPGSGAQRAP